MIVTAVGMASGALIISLLSLVVVVSVVMYFKCKRKAFSLTANVAYTDRHNMGGDNANVPYTADSAEELSVGKADLLVTKENVAYEPFQSSPLVYEIIEDTTADTETQQSYGGVNLVQNVAYKPSGIPLSPNAAYESHQSTENQDEYAYIANGNNNFS